jgi:hypothetical protein
MSTLNSFNREENKPRSKSALSLRLKDDSPIENIYKTESFGRFLDYQRDQGEHLIGAIDKCQQWVMNYEISKGNIDDAFLVQQLDKKIIEGAIADMNRVDNRCHERGQRIAK